MVTKYHNLSQQEFLNVINFNGLWRFVAGLGNTQETKLPLFVQTDTLEKGYPIVTSLLHDLDGLFDSFVWRNVSPWLSAGQ